MLPSLGCLTVPTGVEPEEKKPRTLAEYCHDALCEGTIEKHDGLPESWLERFQEDDRVMAQLTTLVDSVKIEWLTPGKNYIASRVPEESIPKFIQFTAITGYDKDDPEKSNLIKVTAVSPGRHKQFMMEENGESKQNMQFFDRRILKDGWPVYENRALFDLYEKRTL
jgi:hypothetical protein